MTYTKITDFKEQVKVGDKLTCNLWLKYYDKILEITAIGEGYFLGKDEHAEFSYSIYSDWIKIINE